MLASWDLLARSLSAIFSSRIILGASTSPQVDGDIVYVSYISLEADAE